jgi:hypothetical protein
MEAAAVLDVTRCLGALGEVVTGMGSICLLASSGCLPSSADDTVAVAVAVAVAVNDQVYESSRE